MYKITFTLKSGFCAAYPPLFDSILSWAYCVAYANRDTDLRGELVWMSDDDSRVFDFSTVLTIVYRDGLPCASEMFWDKDAAVLDVIRKRKKWDNKNDDIADFGKKKAQAQINKGEFKSYDIPYQVTVVDKVWFYFESNDLEGVRDLLRYVVGLGKHASEGYGEIESYEIEPESELSFESGRILRPIPVAWMGEQPYRRQLRAWKPPYWNPANNVLCYVP